MVKIARLDYAFSEFFKLKIEKPKDVGQNIISAHVRRSKSVLKRDRCSWKERHAVVLQMRFE